MNFLLYCCFSDRFRSTFRSNLTFLSKYCAHYIQPKWKIKTNNHSTSLDNLSSSNHALHGNHLNDGNDFNSKHLHDHLHQKIQENKRSSWFNCFSTSSSKVKSTNHSKLANPLIRIQQTSTSNVSTDADRPIQISIDEPTPKHLSTAEKIPSTTSKHQSLSLYRLNRPILKSTRHLKSHSLTDNNKNKEQIWIKPRQSHSSIEQLFNRRKSSSRKDIIDVTV
jgi:hypothetical protein